MTSGSTTPPQTSGRGWDTPIPTLSIRMAITARKEQERQLPLQVAARQESSGSILPITSGCSADSVSIRPGLAGLPVQFLTIFGSLQAGSGFGYRAANSPIRLAPMAHRK